jgi:spermidine/putrescine transport system permease protein
MATEDLSSGKTQARLMFALLLAPAVVWLALLLVLPHVELAILSLRVRVAPRIYEPSLAQFATFFGEPLYWHTFVRTAVMSIVSTAITLLVAFPMAWTIAKIARARAQSRKRMHAHRHPDTETERERERESERERARKRARGAGTAARWHGGA